MCLRGPIIIPFACMALSIAAQDPMFRRLTLREGMPSNTVYSMVQDRDGFMWFGTDAGAVRYDGTHLDRFDVTNGLSDHEVFGVQTDRHGRVWFLTGNGRPCYWDSIGIHNSRTDTVLGRIQLRSGIRSLHHDEQGAFWFGGLRGELVVLQPDGRVVDREVVDPVSGTVTGHVIIKPHTDGGVRIFCNDRPIDVDHATVLEPALAFGDLGSIRVHPGNRLIRTSHSGVQEWHDDHWVGILDTADVPGAGPFYNAYPRGDRELWVTLQKGGVLWLERREGRWVPVRPVMFTDDLISNVTWARDGSTWLSTIYGGVITFSKRASATAFFVGQRGEREEFLRAHADTASGSVWVGTNQGDVYRLKEELELVDLPPAGPMYSKVSDIRTYRNTLWVATDRHVYRIPDTSSMAQVEEVPSYFSLDQSLPKYAGVKALTIGGDGQVVASMYGLLVFPPDGNHFRIIDDPGIPIVRTYAPHLDERGTLWFEEHGMLMNRGERGVRHFPALHCGSGVRITDITSLGDTLFVATSGEGIMVVVEGDLLYRITERDGLSSDHIQHLFLQGGDLFVACDAGADRVSGPWGTPSVQRYARGVGQVHDVRDVVANDAYAFVLFADGLCRLPRSEAAFERQVPVPYIRAVLVNDSVARDRSIVGVWRGRDELMVELGAVHFTTPELVQLAFRTAPDGSWRTVKEPLLDLSGLAAGDHVLQVRARLIRGAWSEPVQLVVIVIPRLWERWWAITLMILAVLGLVFLILRAMAYRRYRNKEERVRQREILANERQRIAMDLHDDLGAELSSLLLLTRMERASPSNGGMEGVEQIAGQLTDKMKEVIWSTDPGSDTLEATIVFIQRHVINLCERHGLRVRTSIPPVLPTIELKAGIRRELYLIVKEALNNCVKHANANAFTLTVVVAADLLEIDLADNGHGVAAGDAPHGGRGLQNMSERAQGIGATLLVSPVRPHGTRITLRLQLAPGRPNG